MPHFDEFGRETVLCQKCHEAVIEANWRTDITGSQSAGNVCHDCEKKYDEANKDEEIIVNVRKPKGPKVSGTLNFNRQADKAKQIVEQMAIEAQQQVKAVGGVETSRIHDSVTYDVPASGLAALLLEERKQAAVAEDNEPHLILRARAGTGKTTVLIGGIKRLYGLTDDLVPSPQQAAVWQAFGRTRPRHSCLASFGNAITATLADRIPRVDGCVARTLHSLGYYAVKRTFKLTKDPSNGGRCQEIIAELVGVDLRQLRKQRPVFLKAVYELVDKCKQNMSQTDGSSLKKLADHYTVDLGNEVEQIFALVPQVLERCKDVARDGYVDFVDMVWLPVVLKLAVFKNDVMLVDEAQDMCMCQYQFAKMAAKRLIFVGDDRQSIFGFAGAGSEMLDIIYQELSASQRGCEVLPLTVTRRCGKTIVDEAKHMVPDFEAYESNPEGKVISALYPIQKRRDGGRFGQTRSIVLPDEKTYRPMVMDGDMVLCRANAPLVKECFAFIKAGRKATIQGRNIADQLVALVDRLVERTETTITLVQRLADWLAHELAKERTERNPSEQKMETLQDRHDCLRCFCDSAQITVEGVVVRINSLFTDDGKTSGIRLSSIHRAKGLESQRVFYIRGFGRPMDKIKTAWERRQEENLIYVAVTRAIEELIYVDGGGN